MNIPQDICENPSSRIHPYIATGLAWVFLGTATGIVATFPLGRLVFVATSFFVFEMGRNHMKNNNKKVVQGAGDFFWKDLTVRMVSYSRYLFYIWFGVLLHHLLWWQSGFVELTEENVILGWAQSGTVLSCTVLSFFNFFVKSKWRRTILVSIMIIPIFLMPPWRQPWYEENMLITQSRWIVTAILFTLQCFESYTFLDMGRGHLVDLFILRVSWAIVVHPILMAFTALSILYYGFTLLKIKIETIIPQRSKSFDEKNVAAGADYSNSHPFQGIYTQNPVFHQNYAYNGVQQSPQMQNGFSHYDNSYGDQYEGGYQDGQYGYYSEDMQPQENQEFFMSQW